MILVINPGSSSLKYKLFGSSLELIDDGDFVLGKDSKVKTHEKAVRIIVDRIGSNLQNIKRIGMRVVHGGPDFSKPTLVDKQVVSQMKKYSELAALHNRPSLQMIRALQSKFKRSVPVYAVFDSGYFESLPKENSTYALSQEILSETKMKIQRYGFHGISHKFVHDNVDSENKSRLISVHLGAGCSMAAIKKGKVIKTSMGMTPDEGLIMQSRSGDLDPGIVLHLVKTYGYHRAKKIIEHESGLAGLTGTAGSMLDVLYLAGEEISGTKYYPDPKIVLNEEQKMRAQLALTMYVTKIKEYIGAYAALMGGVDIVAFTGKIGANSSYIRNRVKENMDFLGNFKIEIVEPNEELAIAKELIKL